MADEAEHAAGVWVTFTGVLCDEATGVGNEGRSNDLLTWRKGDNTPQTNSGACRRRHFSALDSLSTMSLQHRIAQNGEK
uniref:Uncharacterized protein n=1 Tax=Peronospora matthiolae TaxID=2874970 RepID=A0AAV1UN51_9STRA